MRSSRVRWCGGRGTRPPNSCAFSNCSKNCTGSLMRSTRNSSSATFQELSETEGLAPAPNVRMELSEKYGSSSSWLRPGAASISSMRTRRHFMMFSSKTATFPGRPLQRRRAETQRSAQSSMPRAVPWWNGLGNLRRMPPRMGSWQPGRLRYTVRDTLNRGIRAPSMNRVAGSQREGRDLDVEVAPVGARHLIGAVHHARRRLQWAPRGVFERLPRRQHGLFTHHPGTSDFFRMVRRIGDHPVPVEKLNRAGALVGNPHRVLENPFAFQRPRVLRRVARHHLDANIVGDDFRQR